MGLLAYYVAFGPHGPRAPVNPPGSLMKVFLGSVGCLGVAGLLFAATRALGEICKSNEFWIVVS